MWIPRQKPKTFLISISISRKNYNENKSYWGRQQTLNIKVHCREELAKGRIWEVILLDLTKYNVKPYSLTCLPYKLCTHLFKELLQIPSIMITSSYPYAFIGYLLGTRPRARHHRNIMNKAQSQPQGTKAHGGTSIYRGMLVIWG